ncbi:hypothetical protein [Chitinophaga sp.]|uniref:phage terminase large subunit family protein n=1 Tax=Chitinophaga sp. TaxID=1869181 RepID=UPI002C9D9CDA|nr:hypothetical protein [Chitinophaga sp.]HWV64362.1 hypothetical protein [Chitinophaga sp.]
MKQQITNKNLFRANESELRITLVTGVHIWFKSAEKPDNLYGDDVYAAVFDEFTRARYEAWVALRSTLTYTKGKCKFIGNVKGKKNWGYKLASKAKAGDDLTWRHFKITCYDAAAEGLLSFDEIEAAKSELPEYVFNELYLAEAADDGSNPFGLSYIEKCKKPLSTLPPICYGIDLAKKKDWTVIVGLDRNADVCYIDRFQKDWGQTTDTIKRLPNKPKCIDSTGVGDPIVEQLQQHDNNIEGFKFTALSKQQLIQGLTWAVQNEKTGFPEGVISDEMESFEFTYTATGVSYSAPEGFHDDAVCALGLAWKCWQTARYVGQYDLR